MANEVPVSRGVLFSGAVVIVVLIAAVAFLLGRGSRPVEVADVEGDSARVAATAPTVAAAPLVPAAPAVPVGPAVPVPSAPLVPPTPETPPAEEKDPAAEAAAVREYFQRVELELASAKSFDDASKAALEALNDLSGDGVRTMAAEQKRLRGRLAGVQTPTPCIAHRDAMLASINQGLAMLDKLASSMSRGDTAKLTTVADEGRRVEESARAVDTIAAELKKRYGIKT